LVGLLCKDEFIRKDNPLATEREEEKENDDPKTKESTKVPPEPMEVEVDDDSKKKALEEKEKGNASYKKKDFTAAHEHYDRAIQLDPENITILTNKAAVYFEQGNYEDCLKICEDAVEKGREIRADYKLIAKAFARMGNVYFKQRMWADAIKYYDKSLAEHRTQDVISKKTEAQKNLKEEEQKAYVDVDKSLEEKQRGNDLYQQGKFGDAIQCYTEAIKRNPEDARIFSNRAACYHKLAEWHLAIKVIYNTSCLACLHLTISY
jgi:stress-induced-phosphoprotein 1